MKEYQQSVEDVLKSVQTNEHGLTNKEVEERIKKYGKNELEEGEKQTVFKIFINQFKDLLVIILLIAAMISFFSHSISSAIVILAVIMLNAILGTIQNVKALKTLASLKKLSMPKIKVIRDYQKQEIASSECTIGDIVLIEAGDVIVGDGRLMEAFQLQINESSLTGEAENVNKETSLINVENLGIADQKNMVFSGSLVSNGRGRYVVTQVGMKTQIGEIAHLLNTAKERRTPLQLSLDDFSKKLSMMIVAISFVVFALNLFNQGGLLDSMMIAVALAVAAIPEALSSIVTIVLAIGSQKMANENAIIKNIHSVESLGSISVICTDKTGTLTQNKMTVQHCVIAQQKKELKELDLADKHQRLVMLTSLLCNDSQVEKEQRLGDPSELAFLDYYANIKIEASDLRNLYPRLNELPFDSERKCMSTLHEIDGKQLLLVKGATDELLSRTVKIAKNGEVVAISEDDLKTVRDQNHAYAKQGYRVLSFAYKIHTKNTLDYQDEDQLIYLGMMALSDPLRSESKEAVRQCIRAGIKPVMITGDHALTACAIASEAGIYHEGDQCIDGSTLALMSDDELYAQLEQISVYARVAPAQKIRIVKAWQKHGHIVAMSGDGVNDAPALKQSDIGIAMGLSGSEVSKDAANMILMDDNFATIVKAIMSGRNIYNNIKNAILYLLSGNFAAIIAVLFTSLAFLPIPFQAVHLLFMNLIGDSLPAIAIGMEKDSGDVLNDKPRNNAESILNKQAFFQIAYEGVMIAIFTLMAYFIGYRINAATASTMAFSTLCLARLFHGFNCRTTKSIGNIKFTGNMYSMIAFVIGGGLLALILMVPTLQSIFEIAPLNGIEFILILIFAFMPTIFIQGRKVWLEHHEMQLAYKTK